MNPSPVFNDVPGMQSLKANWGWFLAMGVSLAVFGGVAMSSAMMTGYVVVALLGALLFVGGALQTMHAFWARRWRGFLVHLVTGVVYLVFGWLMMSNPDKGGVVLAIIIAAFLLVGGLIRIILAVESRGDNWFWMMASGVINILLGLVIWRHLELAPEILGLFLGIEMIANGASWIMVALAVRSLPDEPGEAPPLSR
jgi:uncharacterized membrane protein HdeD (DUF308 family)